MGPLNLTTWTFIPVEARAALKVSHLGHTAYLLCVTATSLVAGMCCPQRQHCCSHGLYGCSNLITWAPYGHFSLFGSHIDMKSTTLHIYSHLTTSLLTFPFVMIINTQLASLNTATHTFSHSSNHTLTTNHTNLVIQSYAPVLIEK